MAIAFRSAATNSTGAGVNDITINIPAGVQDGDLLLAVVHRGANGAVPGLPAGWTNLATASVGPSVRYCYKIASGEGASVTFTTTGTSSGAIAAYTGVDPTTPIPNTSASPNRLTATASATATTLTPSVDNCMVVWMAGAGANGSATWTAPGGYTERADVSSSTGSTSTIAELLQTTATATGNVTGTCSDAASNTYAFAVALSLYQAGAAAALPVSIPAMSAVGF